MFLLTALGFENFGIHQGLNGFFINILRNQNFIGNQVRFFLIKLSHIGQEILIWIIVVRKEIDIAFNQLALADKEDLDAHPTLIHIVTKDISVLEILSHDSLLSSQSANSLNQISIFSRTFKFHTLSCLIHLFLEVIDDFVILALKKIRDFLGHRLEKSLVFLTDGVSHALANMVIKTDL